MKRLLLSLALATVTLTTAAAAQSIAGEWDAAMNTPGGVRNFKIIFEVKGDTLTGTVKRGAGDSQLRGTIKGNVSASSRKPLAETFGFDPTLWGATH